MLCVPNPRSVPRSTAQNDLYSYQWQDRENPANIPNVEGWGGGGGEGFILNIVEIRSSHST